MRDKAGWYREHHRPGALIDAFERRLERGRFVFWQFTRWSSCSQKSLHDTTALD